MRRVEAQPADGPEHGPASRSPLADRCGYDRVFLEHWDDLVGLDPR
jgi:hypothetical protein